jgi:hypothetical protein
MKTIAVFIASGVLWGAVGSAFAQTRPPQQTSQSMASALRDPRYQIGLMEGILQRAAEHGAKITRDRVRAVIPGDMLLSDDVRVRGFRLDGYGVFFDIDMPDLEGTLPWIVRTLDRNDLGLDSAFRSIRTLIESSGSANERQALQRIEMQLAPSTPPLGNAALVASQTLAGSAASTIVNTTQTASSDPVVNDPQGVYRAEVIEALIEAILDHSNGLRLEAVEWLTVAARGRGGSPRLSPADTESPTIQISVRGEDLIALLARRISREDARTRIVIKVF